MYQSPVTLSGLQPQYSGPELFRAGLPLARKKLLAEFELMGTDTIQVNGREMNRQEVISVFDELANGQRLEYHMAIWQDATLLLFLEEGKIGPDDRFAWNPLYQQEAFRSFVSPFFAEAQARLLKKLLTAEASLESWQALMANPSLLQPADYEAAYQPLNRFFTEKKNELLNLYAQAQAGETAAEGVIRYSITEAQTALINCLPASFEHVRYTLANVYNNICVEYDKRGVNRIALEAVEQAASFEVQDDELKELIPRNLEVIRGKQRTRVFRSPAPQQQGRERKSNGWLILVVLIALVRIGFALDKCSDSRGFRSNDVVVSFRDPSRSSFDMGVIGEDQAVSNYIRLVSLFRMADTAGAGYGYVVRSGRRPQLKGDMVYGVSQYGVQHTPDSSSFAHIAGGEKQVMLCNNSSWNVIVWYLLDEQDLRNVYLPPGDSLPISYGKCNAIRVDLSVGKNWSDTALYQASLYKNHYEEERIGLQGGYTVFPANARKYCNPDYLPLYSRNEVLGYSYNDRLVLSDSLDKYLSVRKYMDEGRKLP